MIETIDIIKRRGRRKNLLRMLYVEDLEELCSQASPELQKLVGHIDGKMAHDYAVGCLLRIWGQQPETMSQRVLTIIGRMVR